MVKSGFTQPGTSLYDETDAIATIRLNRPEKLNAITFEVCAELRDVFQALQDREGSRFVEITGQGRGFCSVGDVGHILGRLVSPGMQRLPAFPVVTWVVARNVPLLRQPVTASPNGLAAGAVALTALAWDFQFAAKVVAITESPVKLGLSGAGIRIAPHFYTADEELKKVMCEIDRILETRTLESDGTPAGN